MEAGAYSAERASASPSSSSDLVRVCGTVLAVVDCWGFLDVGDEVFKGTKAKAERREDWSGSRFGVWCGVLTRGRLDGVRESMVAMDRVVEWRARRARLDRKDRGGADDGRSIRQSHGQTAAWLSSPLTSIRQAAVGVGGHASLSLPTTSPHPPSSPACHLPASTHFYDSHVRTQSTWPASLHRNTAPSARSDNSSTRSGPNHGLPFLSVIECRNQPLPLHAPALLPSM